MPRIESAVCMMYLDVPITRVQATRRCWWNAGVKTMEAKQRSRTGSQSTNSSFGAVSERIEKDTERRIYSLISVLEPTLVIILSLIVGMILKDVFYPFIVYAIRTFGCAGLMLLAGLIFKEKYSFARMLALASMAVAPAYIAKEFLGTYLGLIPYVRMGTLITTAAYIYYIVMLYKGIGAESKLKDDKKAFVLIGVFAIVGVLAGLFSY